METWMGGGLGRAQGGYDEMVFRAMVRDDAAFLRSAGTRVARHEGRFPDRRERLSVRHAFLHLARVHLFAREGRRLAKARRRERSATTPISSSKCLGCRWRRRGRSGSPSSTIPAERNLAEVRKYPITPHRTLAASAVGSISRVYYDEATGRSTARSATGRGRARRRRSTPATAASGDSPTSSARCSTGSPRSRTTRKRHGLLHQRQPRAAGPDGGGRQDWRGADAARGRAIGEIAFNPADRSLWACATTTGSRRWCAFHPPYDDWNQVRVFRTSRCPTTSTFLRTESSCRRR